jgi:hypothetical protein
MSTINAEPVHFEWEPVEDAERYEIMLMTPSRVQPIYFTRTVPSLELFLNSASGIPGETDGDYSWAVRTLEGEDEEDLGEFSAIWTFRIDTLYDGQSSLMAPLDGESFDQGSPTLEWLVPSDISGTHYTIIQVYNSSVLAPENLTRQEVVFTPDLNLTLNDLETGTYFWRCQAFDTAGNPCDWSAVWNFSIEITEPELPPEAPSETPLLTTLEMGMHYVDVSGTIYVTSMTELNLISAGGTTSDITTMYCIDEGPWLEFYEPFYISGEFGVRNVSFYSSDDFGNAEEVQKIQVVLTGLTLGSSISESLFWDNRIRFTIVVENNWPLDICELELDLDIPEDFRTRHLSVWLRESECWPRPVFLYIECHRWFGEPRTYNFMDEMEITLEENKLSVPWLPAAGKLYVFINLEYAPEGESMRSEGLDQPNEYVFEVMAFADATSPFDPEQGLVDACSTIETLEMYEHDFFDELNLLDSH